jgi:hypothetical protein
MNSRVAEIVARIAPDGDWRKKWEDICEALDEEKVPVPTLWPSRHEWKLWSNCTERPLAVKTIGYRLKSARA